MLDTRGYGRFPARYGHDRGAARRGRLDAEAEVEGRTGPHSVPAGRLPHRSTPGPVPVSWTTHLWQPDRLARLLEEAGFELVAELRFPARSPLGPQVLLAARRPE